MITNSLRLTVILPLLTFAALSAITAYIAFSQSGILVWLAVAQLVALAIALLVARNGIDLERQRRQHNDQLTKAVAKSVDKLVRQLAESKQQADDRAAEFLTQLATFSDILDTQSARLRDLRASTELAHVSFNESIATLGKDLQATTSKIPDTVRVDIRREREQVDAVLGLYHDVKPTVSLPTTGNWAASADLLRFLFHVVRKENRSSVIECGSGVSTLIMAYALRSLGTGTVTALDHEENFAEQTRQLLDEHGLAKWGQVIWAPLTDTECDGAIWPWYDLAELPRSQVFDMLVVDGPPALTGKEARYPALPLLRSCLAPDALVILDDYDRPDERAISKRWLNLLAGAHSERVNHQKGTWVLRPAGK